jgi:hypothetical protein
MPLPAQYAALGVLIDILVDAMVRAIEAEAADRELNEEEIQEEPQ